MKSSLRKLRALNLIKSGARDKAPTQDALERHSYDEIEPGPSVQVLADIQEQYDGLIAAAQSISGSSYDFSRSIHEMASCLVEAFEKFGNGDIGNTFSMLANVQYEISKSLSLYATHVSQAIIMPTENLRKELKSFMEFRDKYEEKRDFYNQMKLHKVKGKNKKDGALNQRLMYIREELDDQAKQLDRRFQSLKDGQELILVTQAARHHKAQVHLFYKGLNSLNAVESMIKQLSKEYQVDEALSDGEAGLQMNEDTYEPEPDVLLDNDEDASNSSIPRLSQLKASEIGVSRRPRPWESSSKSAPLHPLSYKGNIHAPVIQDVDVEQFPEKATPCALPSPQDKNVRYYNQAMSNASMAEELLVGEAPELRRIRAGISGASCEEGRSTIGPSNLEVQSQFDGNQAPKRGEENHNWKENRAFSRGRNPGHSYSTSFSEVLDSFSVTSPSKQGFVASTPTLGYNRTTRETDVIMPAVRGVDPLYKSGPLGRSVPWGFTPPRVSPCSSPLMSHLSPPVISELHKLPAPPSPPPPLRSEPSITPSFPFAKPGVISSALAPGASLSAMNSSVMKSRSIPSSISFSQSLHHSNIVHGDDSPVVESP